MCTQIYIRMNTDVSPQPWVIQLWIELLTDARMFGKLSIPTIPNDFYHYSPNTRVK